MNARLLDVFHDATNQHHFAVADGIDIHFYCIIQEAVQQHRRIVRDADGGLEVTAQVCFVVDDFHCAAAQHVRRTHHQRVTNLFGLLNGHFNCGDGGVGWLFQLQTIYRLLETLAIFCPVNRIRTGTDNRHTCGFQRARQLQRGLAAVLHDNALRLLDAHDFQHVFQGHRLEIQTVRGVVVGRNRLWVTVDHNGLVTVFAQRQRSVYAAVVKFDALADTVWTAAEYHNFIAIRGGICFALVFVRGVHVGGVGGKFCRTGIHAFVDRVQVVLVAQLTDF
ncbi:hypothetical protein D3C75_376300 [compost metagenome]